MADSVFVLVRDAGVSVTSSGSEYNIFISSLNI